MQYPFLFNMWQKLASLSQGVDLRLKRGYKELCSWQDEWMTALPYACWFLVAGEREGKISWVHSGAEVATFVAEKIAMTAKQRPFNFILNKISKRW